MARFDVFRNLGRHSSTTPYVVEVQGNHLDALETRVVVPLRRIDQFPSVQLPPDLFPVFDIEGIPCMLDVPKLAAIQRRDLRDKVGSLAHQRDSIIGALDRLFGAF